MGNDAAVPAGIANASSAPAALKPQRTRGGLLCRLPALAVEK
ncbi:hypothetical protein QNH14_12765 [Apirhabdus apintestini]|nr:hypothetical protein QNH14_12765 [Enterobacteriaceae bacterium CA-0114]